MGALVWIVGGAAVGFIARAVFSARPMSTSSAIKLPAVKNFGVPFATPSGRIWPVTGGNRSVPYTTPEGKVIGNGATAFHASRESGTRYHAGIDLQASPGQRIVAMEDGIIIGTIPGFVKLDAVVVQHAALVAVYAEVTLGSLIKAGLKPGDRVKAGQQIATGSINYDENSMLHLELWRTGFAPKFYTPWYSKNPPPAGLLDPTLYLLQLAKG